MFNGLTLGPRPGVYRCAIGLDFAYSGRQAADYSVACVVAEQAGRYTVVDVVRQQGSPAEFAPRVRALMALYAGAPLVTYIGGTELGVVNLLRGQPHGLPIDARPARGDKWQRAQGVAAAWNRGEVAVLEGAPWAADFASEVLGFTGAGDAHDDQVDALAAAFDSVRTTSALTLRADDFDDYLQQFPL